jgi:molybdopterin-guanine dinucleotide biosynthesis protein A
MPLIETPLLLQLFAEAESANRRCVVAVDPEERLHPLCGVYRWDCLDVVGRAVAERHLRLMNLLTELGAAPVRSERILKNCNTPEEWAAALRA